MHRRADNRGGHDRLVLYFSRKVFVNPAPIMALPFVPVALLWNGLCPEVQSFHDLIASNTPDTTQPLQMVQST